MLMIMWMTCAFGFLVAIMFIFHDGIWYYFGVLVVGIMIISMMVSVIIFWEYYFGYHAAFGLLVVSMIIFMMLVDVLLLGVLFSEMMFTCGS